MLQSMIFINYVMATCIKKFSCTPECETVSYRAKDLNQLCTKLYCAVEFSSYTKL